MANKAQGILPDFEGLAVAEEFDLDFGGKVTLEAFNEMDKGIIDDLKLGKTITLTVTGRVMSRPHKVRRETKKNPERVISSAKLVVDSIMVTD